MLCDPRRAGRLQLRAGSAELCSISMVMARVLGVIGMTSTVFYSEYLSLI